jgi:predicted alpha/beta-fold hydrolase
LFPALFRRVRPVTDEYETLELPDGDFLNLHWKRRGSSRLAILCHGLEGSARSPYVQGMATALWQRGWDVLAWDLRGCGSPPNRLPKFYHSGATEDLAAVVDHARHFHKAGTIDLVGFSLGGNLVLKYLGERTDDPRSRLGRAVAFSVPCDLACSSKTLAERSNALYMWNFLRALQGKIREKHARFPTELSIHGLSRIRTFREFDDRFTAPLHGFRDAADYWTRSSCRSFLSRISVPTLLVNAVNDPFLGSRCYPTNEALASHYFHLEMPAEGGHVGFSPNAFQRDYWSEARAAEFLLGTSSSHEERNDGKNDKDHQKDLGDSCKLAGDTTESKDGGD